MVKLTALITTYNQKSYIEEAVDSVLKQKCSFKFDVVIGDDGSNDGTWELLNEKYAHVNNIKLIRMDRSDHTDNVAATRASRIRLELLKHVRGEYFCFLDGDDFYSDIDKFQKQVDVLDKPENGDCVVCASNMALYYEGKTGEEENIKPVYAYGLQPRRIERALCWKKVFFHASACVFRSDLIPKLPMDLLDYVYNDHIIFLSAIVHGEIYYISDITMYYRQVMGGSIWVSGNKLVNVVRSVMTIDIGDQLYPELKKENHYRYRAAMYDLYRNRKVIAGKSIDYWHELAYKLKCKEAISLIEYQSYPMYRKCWITVRIKYRWFTYETPKYINRFIKKVIGLVGYIVKGRFIAGVRKNDN